MDVAVTPAHGTERGAEVRADGIENRFTKREPAGSIPDEGGEDIGFLQRNANRGAEGFLAATKKDAAMDFSSAIKRGKFLIQQPRPQHKAEGGQLRRANSGWLGDSLQHGESLSPRVRSGNDSFGDSKKKRLAAP